MRILFLSRWLPYPPDNGSKLRIYNLLRGLGGAHVVDLIAFAGHKETAEAAMEGLVPFCSSVRTIPYKTFNPRSLSSLTGYLDPRPRSVLDTFSRAMADSIGEALHSARFDAVVVSQIDMASYRKCFRGIPALLEEVEVGVMHSRLTEAKSVAGRCRRKLTWIKHRHYLASALRDFPICTVVSDKEQQLVEQIAPAGCEVKVIPNGVDVPAARLFHMAPRPNTLIFNGSIDYFPNWEAMDWFQREIFPRIRVQAPSVSLAITGEHSMRMIDSIDGVRLTGLVDDVRPLVSGSWCCVVPLKTGGGTRLKILEAMSLGTPVVSTSKGVEGLDARHEEHLLVADSAESFANSVVRLLESPELRERLARAALRLTEEKYSWDGILPQFLEIVGRLPACSGPGTAR